MQKLKPKDIIFISEGKQLKERILRTYTFKEFAHMTDHTELTLKRYLGKKIIINKFKKDIKKIYNKDLNSLINTLEHQFENYFIHIFNNIELYNQSEDIQVFYKLIDQAPTQYHNILGKILIAHYRYNVKLEKEACYKLEQIIQKSKKYEYHELIILAVSELGFMYLKDLNKSLEIFHEHNSIITTQLAKINKITKLALYKYHYKYGVVLNRAKRYDDAISQFKHAMSYTDTNNINQVYSSFANSFACQGEYEESEKQLFKALDCVLSLNDKLIIYNNLACLYSYMNDRITDSKRFITTVIDSMNDSIPIDKRMNYIHTLLTIYNYQEGCLNFNIALKLIRDINKSCNNIPMVKNYVQGLLTYCEKNNDMIKSKRVFDTFRTTIQKLPSNDFTVQLKGIYFDIYFAKGVN